MSTPTSAMMMAAAGAQHSDERGGAAGEDDGRGTVAAVETDNAETAATTVADGHAAHV